MGLELAAVVIATWQWVVMIVLCFGSLIIALYCLFFMVPLKSFVDRIGSLGGGMKGIRAHVDGVRGETEERIAAVQERVEEELDESHSRLHSAVEAAAEKALSAQAGVQRLERTTQGLQADWVENSSGVRDLSASIAALHKGLEELHSDFEALQAELSGSIAQAVSESYQRLEGTVLSALDVIKDEMLRGVTPQRPPLTHPSRPLVDETSGRARRTSDKIIQVGPLLSGLEKGKRGSAEGRGREGGEEAHHDQEHPAPAK